MCGIVGIYAKSESISDRLGELGVAMLSELADRGPDSAGVAIYRRPVGSDETKLCLLCPEGASDWSGPIGALDEAFGVLTSETFNERYARVIAVARAEEAQRWVATELPGVQVASAGQSIELYKDAMDPIEFTKEYGIASMEGSHLLGHTRMATESRVTPAGSHPFSTGLDLCLVHNGSLSNHNRLRTELERADTTFFTANDTEVAAGYLTSRLREGATLEGALEGCLQDLDGFYTFAVGTADGFAVLRDPIACKPAVMAETDDWVAMASEFRAIATLPDAEEAEIWEPEPGVVYSWGKVPA